MDNHKMLKKITIAILALSSASAFALDAQQQKEVKNIIQLFKNKDIQGIIHHVQYPLNREAGIPSIKNAKEMQQRFEQVFDPTFQKKIASSTLTQWSEVGSEGVMFEDGQVWLNEDKISAVNYSSTAEQAYRTSLIKAQKNNLHESVKNFINPVLMFETATFTIRVDEITQDQYRYASWKKGQPLSSKPELVLTKGTVSSMGSDAIYSFNSGPYRYEVATNLYGGESNADVLLLVEKNNTEVLSQEGMFKN